MNTACIETTEVQSFLKQNCPDLLSGNESIVLAVSGGPDSIAMLEIINDILRKNIKNTYNIIVAHLNHSLRGQESDQDAYFVLDHCQKLGLNCIIKKLDINETAKQTGQSIETAARNARYDFLTGICREHNCRYLATAHHADDNAETILHRIIRGTGINGLAGIQPKRFADNNNAVTIIRPLLGLTRSRIEKYLVAQNVTSRYDSSNDSNDYTRNNLRNRLIPEIENSFNPNFKQALNNLGNIAADSAEILNSVAQGDIDTANAVVTPGLFQVSLGYLNSLTNSRAKNMLRYAIDKIMLPLADIGCSKIDYIRAECLNEKTRIIADLSNNWTAEISQKNLIIALKTDSSHSTVELDIPGQVEINKLLFIADLHKIRSVSVENVDTNNFDIESFRKNKTPYQEIIDLNKTAGTLYITSLKPSIHYRPLGLAGTQTTGDIMTNFKVPQYLRNNIAAIYDDHGLICIAGHRIAENVKFTSQTRNAILISFKK